MQRECENVGGTAEGWFDKYSSALVLKGHNNNRIYLESDLFLAGFHPSVYLLKDLSLDSNLRKDGLRFFGQVIGFVRFPVSMQYATELI